MKVSMLKYRFNYLLFSPGSNNQLPPAVTLLDNYLDLALAQTGYRATDTLTYLVLNSHNLPYEYRKPVYYINSEN